MPSNEKVPSLSEYDILMLLVLEHETKYISNSLLARILRKYPTSTRRVLKDLKDHKLIRQNFLHKYKISKKGLDVIQGQRYDNSHYDKVRNLIKHLKNNPEKEGWKPSQFDNGNLTLLESAILYLFEKNESLFNAEIARMFNKYPESTWKELDSLVQKNLLAKNEYDAGYHVTQKGLELIERNVSKNTLCKYIREYAINLKKDPTERELCIVLIGGLTTLGLTSTTAFATSSVPITVTSIQSAVAATPATMTGTTITSILTTKTVLASIVATIMVTGGITGPYALDPNMFGNSIPDDVNTINENNNLSTYQKLSSSNSYSDTGTSSKPATSSVSSNTQSATTTQSTRIPSQENNVENTQNDSQTAGFSGSSSTPSLVPNTTQILRNINPENSKPSISSFVENIHPSGMIFDSNGNMYVTEQRTHSVKVFDSNGNILKIIGNNSIIPVSFEFTELEVISKLSSLFVQYAHAVEILYCEISTGEGCIDPDGLGRLEIGDGQFNDPFAIAVDSQDNIYVVDRNNHRIQVFDSNGIFISKFGEYGNGDGQFRNPDSLAVDSQDNIYVADFPNDRIQVFDSNGIFISKFGKTGSDDGQFLRTGGVAVDSQDNIYVVDVVNNRIQVFDSNGIFISKFGEYGNGDGQFQHPSAIVIDSQDNIYVVDRNNHRIQVFDSNGIFISKFGEYGSGIGQMDLPLGIAVDSQDNIYVSDTGNSRIQKISFEDAIATFSEQFNDIMCNTDSMINDPVEVPPKIAAALPLSELLPRADSLTFDIQQYEESLLFYYIASQIQPLNVNAWNGIGYTQTQICSNNSAETAYTQALSIDPNNINAKIGLFDFTINQVTRDGNASILKLEDAELQLQSVLELDSRNTNALNALGYIETLRENYNTAIDYYEQSLNIDSKKTTTLNGLAFAHLRSDNLDNATTDYLKVLNIDSTNFNALVGLITTYTQQGTPELAASFIDNLDESNGIIADKLREQGNWLKQNGQTQEAQRLFDAATNLK